MIRHLVLYTAVVGALLLFLAVAAVRTLRLGGAANLGVSGADLLDAGTVQRLLLQQVTVGGTVLQVHGNGVDVRDRRHRVLHIVFAPHASFLEGTTAVTAAAIQVGAHLTVQALPSHGSFAAYKVHISPHLRAVGGRVISTDGLLEIMNRHGVISLVRVLPDATIKVGNRIGTGPVPLHAQVVALAYPDPTLHGVDLADQVTIIQTSTQRWGGMVKSIDAARHAITMLSKIDNRTYTVEVRPQTQVTLSRFKAGYADMRPGDHLTIIGRLDASGTAIGPNPILARYVRIGSPSFGGPITAISSVPRGGVILTVAAHHGHVLRIAAPGKAQVLMKTAYGQETAHVLDLAVGERIAAQGTRTGTFALTASSINVYPRQQSAGGNVASILPGRYRIVATDGSQTIVHTTSQTVFTLNGAPASQAAVTLQAHLRVRGFTALHSDTRSIPTLIATHISVTIKVRTVQPARKQPPRSDATPSASPHATPTATPRASARSTPGLTPPAATPTGTPAPNGLAPASSDNAG